jgi:hypothetical protein
MIERQTAKHALIRIDRRHFVAGGVGLGLGLASMPALAAGPIGNVVRVQGDALVRRAEQDTPLATAAEIFVNDTVSTGTGARLVLNLGLTELRLGASARMRIDRFLAKRGGVVDLESGPMLFDRPEDAPKTDIEFRSLFAVVAVRGTRFFAGPSNGVFGVFVERGALDVIGAGKTVRLIPGQGSNVKTPGDAPSDAAPWKPARVERALASVY